MSAIKTTQVDGDVSVGRNVAIGGSATVQGNTHLKGNVKVDGWLDAKNIKGANKGIFTTIKKLREAYPMPHDGWWAIVGKALPGPIYVGDGGEWVATGEVGGNPTIDSEQYDKEQYDKAVNEVQKVARDLNTFKGTKGNPNGIVPLNANGKISTQYMPASVDDVKDFDGFVKNVTIQQTYIGKNAKDEGYKVVFNTITKTFILLYESVYYSNWVDADSFGTYTPDGIVPTDDKIYADTTTNKTYRWSGYNLIIIGSDLALGYTSETAFPGNAGVQVQKDISIIKQDISDINEKNKVQDTNITMHGNSIKTLQGQMTEVKETADKAITPEKLRDILTHTLDLFNSNFVNRIDVENLLNNLN